MTRHVTRDRRGRLHRRRAALRPQPGRPVQARDGQGRQHLRHGRHGRRAASRPSGSSSTDRGCAVGWQVALGVPADGRRRRDRGVAGAARRDDADAAAHRDAAQLRRPRRGAGRLQHLAARRDARRRQPATTRSTSIEVFLGVFIGAVTLTGSIVAFLKLSARIPSKPLMLPARHGMNLVRARSSRPACWCGSCLTGGAVPLIAHDRHRAGLRLAPRRVDRRRRHAGRRVDAQQLLRVGRGRRRLHARQRPAHRHRRPRRLLRCLPVLHHVPGHEPLLRLGHRRRVRLGRRRRRPTTPTTASTARPPPWTSPTCSRTPEPSSSRPATGWRSPRRSTPSPI